jgi:hypothetical protein
MVDVWAYRKVAHLASQLVGEMVDWMDEMWVEMME